MVQSSTFTSIPAGMIVVPAKQFGPAAWERQERRIEKGKRRGPPQSVPLFSGEVEDWSKELAELGDPEQTYRSFHGHASVGLFLQH